MNTNEEDTKGKRSLNIRTRPNTFDMVNKAHHKQSEQDGKFYSSLPLCTHATPSAFLSVRRRQQNTRKIRMKERPFN